MNVDVAIVGGGVAGAGLATLLARAGRSVLVLEREERFKDRVRGENMLPWGVAIARRLGLIDDLVAAGGHRVPFFNIYDMGQQTLARPLPATTPHGEASLNMYHPDMQEALLAGAVRAGAEVSRGAIVHGIAAGADGQHAVTYDLDGESRSVVACLVVGADGRSSRMREWGGFQAERDPANLRIAGTLVEGSSIPEDGTCLGFGPGFKTFIAPLGGKRARTYFIYPGAGGHRKLSGKEKLPEFLDLVRATRIPSAWFEGVTTTSPLAEFDGADHWVRSPAKPGLALIGDAAAATDPSWGCGLSKTMADVENLCSCLQETSDWDAALRKYAAVHDDYYWKLHGILACMTDLFWAEGPAADERRARVAAKMEQDPTSFPDAAGLGPFGPCDERARRNLLGLD